MDDSIGGVRMKKKFIRAVETLFLMMILCAATYPVTGSDHLVSVKSESHSAQRAPHSFYHPSTTGVEHLPSQQPRMDTPLFYGYVAYDASNNLPEGPCFFSPLSPDEITSLAPTSSASFIAGATMANDGWWGCEFNDDTEDNNANIWKINTTNGDMALVGSYDPADTGLNFNGLSYDPIREIMYACSNNKLYTVDMNTGASTFVATIDAGKEILTVGIACDDNGVLYAEDIISDCLYTIDTTTGKATLVGAFGVDLIYAQDIAFDHSTYTMYLSACVRKGGCGWESALYTVNLSTGRATRVGTFQKGVSITGFAIPFVPILEISEPMGGFGMKVTLKNVGFENAQHIEWAVTFNGGTLFLPAGYKKTGVISHLAVDEEASIRAIPFGFGGLLKPWTITISARADNATPVILNVQAKLLLFFMILI